MSIQKWPALLVGGLLALAAHAQDLHPDGQSFERRRWTQADGAPQHAMTLCQTDDGMLWFGALSGLHNFDGIRFNKVSKVYGHDLLSTNIMFAYKVPEGLAVGYYFGGLSIFKPGAAAVHYTAGKDFPRGTTMDLAVDHAGVIHVATSSGVAALRGGKWLPVGLSSLPKGVADKIAFDHSGRLWVQVGNEHLVRPLDSERFVPVQVPAGAITTFRGDGLYARLPGKAIARLDVASREPAEHLDRPQAYQGFPERGQPLAGDANRRGTLPAPSLPSACDAAQCLLLVGAARAGRRVVARLHGNPAGADAG